MRHPLLTTLVLILFDEGGVGSMKAKRKIETSLRKNSRFEKQQEMW